MAGHTHYRLAHMQRAGLSKITHEMAVCLSFLELHQSNLRWSIIHGKHTASTRQGDADPPLTASDDSVSSWFSEADSAHEIRSTVEVDELVTRRAQFAQNQPLDTAFRNMLLSTMPRLPKVSVLFRLEIV